MQNKFNSLFFSLLYSCFLLTSQSALAESSPPLTHKLTPVKTASAPPLKFNNLDEEPIDLKDYRGKVVVVNFWATWCPPCRREMSSLQQLYQTNKQNNIEVLAVNIGEDIDTVFSFYGTIEPTPEFTTLLDLQGSSMKRWAVQGLPTTYIVNKQGEIVYKAVGGREFNHPSIAKTLLQLTQ